MTEAGRAYLGDLLTLLVLLAFLGLAVGEEDESVGLGGAEVEGDGAHALGVPLGQADEGLGGLEGDGVQRGDVLASVGHLPLDLHLGVHDARQPGQLQADVVVLVHHLGGDGGGFRRSKYGVRGIFRLWRKTLILHGWEYKYKYALK